MFAAVWAAAVLLGTAAGESNSSRFWTSEAIIEAPRVVETAITADGRSAAYIVRRDHLDGNRRDSTLVWVDLRSKNKRDLLTASWISRLSAIPGSTDWSVLADEGSGIQLYRVTTEGTISLVVRGQSLVTMTADTTRAIIYSTMEPDEMVGVVDYGWAPNGGTLWYSTASPGTSVLAASAAISDPTVPKVVYAPNRSELHVLTVGGGDRLVASSGGYQVWPTLFYGSDAAKWRWDTNRGSYSLDYGTPSQGEAGNQKPTQETYDPVSGQSTPGPSPALSVTIGPNGGQLSVQGASVQRRLVERKSDGTTLDFGPADFSLNTARNPGNWILGPGGSVVVAIHHDALNARSSLIRLDRDGSVHEFETAVSIDHCAFSDDALRGVCIREGLAEPPTLVEVDSQAGTQTTITDVDPGYSEIAPLFYLPGLWSDGPHRAAGFVVLPRGYRRGTHYPAIVLTHGYDGDNAFVKQDFQWSYPLQAFAERGYVVICINDIPVQGDAARSAAYSQVGSGAGDLSADQVEHLFWLDELGIYKAAVRALSDEGLIDQKRVGIAGYSRGSQMVEISITQTDLFKAASSGDGQIFAPSTFWMGNNPGLYGMLLGGPVYDPSAWPKWQQISPTLRAKRTTAPVLFEIASMAPGAVDFYHALRSAGAPAEFVYYPDETHLPNVPQDRLRIMTENLDWFDFWLNGKEDPDPRKADQYRRWEGMKVGAMSSPEGR